MTKGRSLNVKVSIKRRNYGKGSDTDFAIGLLLYRINIKHFGKLPISFGRGTT